jgi:hypothetical protein
MSVVPGAAAPSPIRPRFVDGKDRDDSCCGCPGRATPPRTPEVMEKVVMATRSVHKESRKKQVRTLKEKRAARKAKNVVKPAPLIPPRGH